MYCNVSNKYRKFKKTKISYILKKQEVFLLFTVSVVMNMKKYLKKKKLKY